MRILMRLNLKPMQNFDQHQVLDPFQKLLKTQATFRTPVTFEPRHPYTHMLTDPCELLNPRTNAI